jgi:two-component system, LuxR family, response regulator FixJ
MANSPVVHVIDDDAAARDALTFLLSSANFLVRAYESAKSFFTDVPTAGTGCIITDVRMPEISGLELLRQLKNSGSSCPVIVITGQADVPVAIEAIKLGAVDFIEKPYDAEVLLGAVKFALSGQVSDVRNSQWAEIQQKLATLSPQEQQVLQLLVDGHLSSSIAHDLGLNVHIVEVHRANVMTKMQATSLSHLVRMMLLVAS